MSQLKLNVLSLRYSSWSMRAWLALSHAGADFATETVELPNLRKQAMDADGSKGVASMDSATAQERRALGSVRGFFPVLWTGGVPIHESLAICEYVADTFPQAELWPREPLLRAQARAISCEMLSGFMYLRGELSCHLFGRVPSYSPSSEALAEIDRVLEIWDACLQRSGGPFLFGSFSIADAMYFPVLTRFRTYGIEIPDAARAYGEALDALPAVQRLIATAVSQPKIPIYDEYLVNLGGNTEAALMI